MTPLEFLFIARDVIFSPRVFFRRQTASEGLQRSLTFALIVLYVKAAMFYIISYNTGYFVKEEYGVTPYTMIFAGAMLIVLPVVYLFLLSAQCYFLFRIGRFFGGIGILESAVKAICYPLVITIFEWNLLTFPLARLYTIIVALIAIRHLFNIDYLSSFLSLFFSFIFSVFFYLFILLPPAIYLGIFTLL